MKSQVYQTTVQGKTFKYWSDFVMRATYAEDENGNVKRIRSCGYVSNDLTARKAIACVFGFNSFRK